MIEYRSSSTCSMLAATFSQFNMQHGRSCNSKTQHVLRATSSKGEHWQAHIESHYAINWSIYFGVYYGSRVTKSATGPSHEHLLLLVAQLGFGVLAVTMSERGSCIDP